MSLRDLRCWTWIQLEHWMGLALLPFLDEDMGAVCGILILHSTDILLYVSFALDHDLPAPGT